MRLHEFNIFVDTIPTNMNTFSKCCVHNRNQSVEERIEFFGAHMVTQCQRIFLLTFSHFCMLKMLLKLFPFETGYDNIQKSLIFDIRTVSNIY